MNETLRCNRNEAACLISLVMMECIYIVMTEKDSAALTPVHADTLTCLWMSRTRWSCSLGAEHILKMSHALA